MPGTSTDVPGSGRTDAARWWPRRPADVQDRAARPEVPALVWVQGQSGPGSGEATKSDRHACRRAAPPGQAGPDRGSRQLDGPPGLRGSGSTCRSPAFLQSVRRLPAGCSRCYLLGPSLGPRRQPRPGPAMHFPMSGEPVPGPSFGSFAEVGKLADRRSSRPVRRFRFFAQTPETAPICAGPALETAPHVELRAVCLGNHPRTERERRLMPCLQGFCRQKTGKHSERAKSCDT